MKQGKYIILEIIPTSRNPKTGRVAQISAIKLDGLNLIDRFDYRLKEEEINNEFVLEMVNYDKDKFKYVSNTKTIINKLKKFCGNLDLLIIDNSYTNDYLEDFKNKKESVFDYLNMSFHDDIIEEMIKKYNLEPSNYIVDLLYEALIYESGKNE